MVSTRAPRTRELILAAAEARFAAKGYDATSLGDIADDVGIRAPSLYKHFESKRALYLAVVERLLDPYFALLDNLLVEPKDASEAAANLEAVMAQYLRTPRLASLVQHAALAGGDELDLLVERWYRPLFRRATELSRHAPGLKGEKRDAAALVIAFHSMLSGYVTMAALHARASGRDPQAPRALAEFTRVLRSLARGLWLA
jgi:TetR/AcrR family transcriptional regulator